MANYQISTTAPQETALTALVARVNAKRAAETPPKAAVTNQQYLDAVLGDVLGDYVRQARRTTALGKLNQTDKDALQVRDDE